MYFKSVVGLVKNLGDRILHKIKQHVRVVRKTRTSSPFKGVPGKMRYISSGLRPLKTSNKIFVFLCRPNRILRQNAMRLMVIACLCVVIVALGLLLPKVISTNNDLGRKIEGSSDEVASDLPAEPATKEKGEQEPKPLPIIDLSGSAMDLETAMVQINEPTTCGRELIYSAGNASSIDGPVLTNLFLYNLDTKQETVVAETKVKFGEIYEGRFNKDWIVWLDTNQSGTNNIYVLNRKTGEVSQVKRCDLNKPQLVLYGDNLVWVEQKDEENDRLYLYNFKSGEPITLESFNNPTYGTCPPALYNDVLVWVYPHPQDPGRSIIKKLDLKQALSVGTAAGQTATPEQSDEGEPTDVSQQGESGETVNGSARLEAGADTYSGSEQQQQQATAGTPDDSSDNQQGEGGVTADSNGGAQQTADEGVEPEIIDPKGFAIYPQTNGEVIAWLDNLDPSKAKLMMTRDDGKNITVVAENVGRLFGVGDKFIVYTQDDSIMLYFWEINRYARLTKPGEKGMLSKACVSGNTVVWYDANDPAQKKDLVKISIVEQPSL